MKKNEFSILHELKDSQFLVDTTYEHGEEAPFKLTMKFWCKYANGFVTMGLSWTDENEKDFKRTFDELKNIDKAQEYFTKFNNIGK